MKFIGFLFNEILFVTYFSKAAASSTLLETFKSFFDETTDYDDESFEHSFTDTVNYDFIIVGGGTAGCVLASRLSENPKWNVLLIEAGEDESVHMGVPLVTEHLQTEEDITYKYKTTPSGTYCLGMSMGECTVPRGKVMGGTSVLEYALYARGHREDYDKWASLGNKGWAYKDVLPYFKKIEDFQVPKLFNKSYHHTGGPLAIRSLPYRTTLAHTLMNASDDADWKRIDYNAGTMNGISYVQTTIDGGFKTSSYSAYMKTARSRPNLFVQKNIQVHKISVQTINGKKKAVGVEVEWRSPYFWTRKIKANKEVIVTAGAIGSPHLLMLSGIGPRDDLEKKKIPVLKHLSVGYNLMDHVAIGGLIYIINSSMSLRPEKHFNTKSIRTFLETRSGPLSLPAGLEVCSFHSLKGTNSTGRPDLALFYMDSGTVTHRTMSTYRNMRKVIYKQTYKAIRKRRSFMILPTLLHPASRGRVQLADDKLETNPLISPNYFHKPEDLANLIKGVAFALQITRDRDMLKIGAELYQEPLRRCKHEAFATKAYWKCLASHLTFSMHDLCGTCKMGPAKDRQAVVNAELEVHGIENLRVADASVIPEITSGPIIATVYMIAEKAADMIKKRHGFKVKSPKKTGNKRNADIKQ